ncbi:MAG: hypothetical protein HOV81_08745 [Kofleriaceae bacterium]|nr:hypothetical protein [Kofleriaceae bacterium]
MFAELLGRATTAQMVVLGISGTLLDDEQIAVIDDIVTAMSSADPRLWPFKVTRLAASHGTAPFGVAATLVAGEGGMYGSNRLLDAARWLAALGAKANGGTLTDDEVAAELAGAAGFGVVYRARDERFEALVRQLERRRREHLPFTALCLQAARVARERIQVEAHVYLLVAAICLDLGLQPDAIAAFGVVFLFHDSLANAVEGARQAPTVLQALPRECVEYRGRAARRSPRAAGQLV